MAKYLKVNSKKGYIEDTAEIAHVKFNNMRHVILGCMLGDFDNNGEYFVSPEIVAELINMDKHIIESIDNIDICESFLKLDKPITFAITFQNDKATLSLLEKINHGANFKLNAGSYSDINEYVLAEIETSGAVDKNAIYRMWNVKMSGGEALDVFHMDPETIAKFNGVVRRFKYLLVVNKKLLQKEERIEEIESTYFNKMMSLLARYPKLKIAVEKEIKNQFDEKTGMLRLDKPNLMKTMNEIVTDAIEDNIDLLDEKEKKSFEVEKHNIENEYNIEITKEVDISTQKVEQKDLNADPVIIPVIETFGEEDKKSAEELAKEFVEEENNVEKRVQDDMVTFATGGKIPEKKEEKNSEVEESKNLIVESIKGDNNEVKKNNEETVELSDFQRACIAAASKHKKGQENQSDDNVNNMPGAQKRKAIQGIIGIRLEKEVVYTPTGPATVESTEVTAVVKEEKNGKKTTLVLSQKGLKSTIKSLTGNETQLKIQETEAQVVAKVDDKTKTEEKQAEAKKENKLITKTVEETTKKTTTPPKTTTKKTTTPPKTTTTKKTTTPPQTPAATATTITTGSVGSLGGTNSGERPGKKITLNADVETVNFEELEDSQTTKVDDKDIETPTTNTLGEDGRIPTAEKLGGGDTPPTNLLEKAGTPPTNPLEKAETPKGSSRGLGSKGVELKTNVVEVDLDLTN